MSFEKTYKRPAKIFAGIGNRDTPLFFADLLTKVGKRLSDDGYFWATGGSGRADEACMNVSVKGFVYPPWDRFNGLRMRHALPKKAFDKAKEFCDHWDNMTRGPRALHARNMMIITGPYIDVNDAVDLVICYTRDGCDSHASRNKGTGGTGSAISYADSLGIPIVNLFNRNAMEHLTLFTGVDFTDIVIDPVNYLGH